MAVKATSLVTLAQVLSELDLVSDGGVQDWRLEGYIDRISDLVEQYCNRKFSRALITAEGHGGYQGPYMIVDRPPINNATTATIVATYLSGGTAIDTDLYAIHDPEAGILYASQGWSQRTMFRNNIAHDPFALSVEKTWFIDYDGGYITSVQSATVGGTYVGMTPTLPGPVEQAVMDVVKLWNATQSATPGVVEEKIGDASERSVGAVDGGRSDQRSLPPSVRAMLSEYRLQPGNA